MKLAHQLRPLSIKRDILPHAEGSALITMGNTQVMCVATVEDKAPDHAIKKGQGWVHAEYAMLPRSGEQRTSRSKAYSGGRSQEISRLIGRSLRAVVDLSLLYPYGIIIDCDVLRADGGTRTAAVNGGVVALVSALSHLKRAKKISALPVRELVGAVSVGCLGQEIHVDVCYEQDKSADTDMNVVMTASGLLIEIQATAEGAPLQISKMQDMLKGAKSGINKIIAEQQRVLKGILK